MPQNKPNPNKDKPTGLQSYARYSGIAFQMIAIILIFTWAGRKIDEHFLGGKTVFIIILSLAGIAIALYVVLKDFLHSKGKE